jgi:hypothetical protein
VRTRWRAGGWSEQTSEGGTGKEPGSRGRISASTQTRGRGRNLVYGDALRSARTQPVRVEAREDEGQEGGIELVQANTLGSTRTHSRLHGRLGTSARTHFVSVRTQGCIYADMPIYPRSNFITDATVCLSHGRPSGHRPIVRPSARPQSSA